MGSLRRRTVSRCILTAASLGDVLLDAWKSQWMPELMASLPISGVDGTMKARNVPTGAAHM